MRNPRAGSAVLYAYSGSKLPADITVTGPLPVPADSAFDWSIGPAQTAEAPDRPSGAFAIRRPRGRDFGARNQKAPAGEPRRGFSTLDQGPLVGIVDAGLLILIPHLTVPTVVGTGKRSRSERTHEAERNEHREQSLHLGRLSISDTGNRPSRKLGAPRGKRATGRRRTRYFSRLELRPTRKFFPTVRGSGWGQRGFESLKEWCRRQSRIMTQREVGEDLAQILAALGQKPFRLTSFAAVENQSGDFEVASGKL